MRFRRKLSKKTEVNLVPMIDIVFQLVIYFMVSTTIIVTPGVPIVYPESTSSEPVAMSKLVITAVSENELYLNKKQYNLAGLRKAFDEFTEKDRENISTVVIEGDENVNYNLMIHILDILRDNGIRGVNFKTRSSDENLHAVTD
jgi:biopolymer transport protein ExbD